MLIISIYDCCWNFSIMLDDKIMWPDNDDLANEIRKAYHLEDDFRKWLKNKFKDKTIIICEDGGIEKI